MAETTCNAGYGNSGEQQQGCVSVSQAMNSDNWQVRPPAMSCQNVIDGGVVNPLFRHKNRLFRGKLAHKGRKLNHSLPVNLDFSDRGSVFCGEKTTFFFVIPSLADGKRLMRKIKILRSQCQRFGKTHPGLGDQEYQPVPINVFLQVEVTNKRMQFELIQIFDLFFCRSFPFDNGFARWISFDESIINGIHDCPLQLMVKIHCGLPLMAYGIVIEKLLI